MKRVAAVLMAVILLGCIAAAQALEADSYVMTYGAVADQQQYYGSWDQAYRQILEAHSAGIHAYQSRTLEYDTGDPEIRGGT